MLWSLSDYGLRIIQYFSFCGLAKKCWDVALRELQCPLFLWTSREDSVGLASARLHWFRQHVTWLILPVVICLSQRLSHACLSVNNSYETANGSLNQLSFIWWSLTTWITVVILELIHAQRPDFGRAVFIRFKADIFWWFIITFRTSCLYGGGDSFKFLPYQLSMVG